MPTLTQIKNRNGTAAGWAASNPVLAAGEIGHETDHGRQKIGNGTSSWDELPYAEKCLDPMSFGAKGDGATDDTTAIQAAIDAMSAIGGGDVYLPPSVYRTKTPLRMRTGVTVCGGGAKTILFHDPDVGGDASEHAAVQWCGVYTDYPLIKPINDDHPPTLIIMLPGNEGDLTITCATPGDFNSIAAEDWIQISEGEPGAHPAGKWNIKLQFVRVMSRAGDTLTLDRALEWTFDGTSSGAAIIGVIRIAPVVDAWIRNLTVRTGVNAAFTVIGGLVCGGGIEQCIIDSYVDPATRGTHQAAINDSHAFTVRHNVFTHGACNCFNRASHTVLTFNQFLAVGISPTEMSEAASYCTSAFNKFMLCHIDVSSFTLGIGNCIHCEVVHNEFSDVPYNVCICVNGAAHHLRINYNRIVHSMSTGIAIANTDKTRPILNVQIIGNDIKNDDAGYPAIDVPEYPYVEDLIIAFNDVSESNTAATYDKIKIGSSSVNCDRRTITIVGNKTGVNADGSPCTERTHLPWGSGWFGWHYNYNMTGTIVGSYDAGSTFFSDNRLYPTSGVGSVGFFVAVGGTYGTLVGITGTIDISDLFTLTVNDGTLLKRGQYITIAGVAGKRRIAWVVGNVVTFATAADAAVAGGAVAYSPPTVAPLPGGGGVIGDSTAVDVATLKADFNILLAYLRGIGTLSP
jgi:hypothetical protein